MTPKTITDPSAPGDAPRARTLRVHDDRVRDALAPEYLVQEPLGTGGFGTVYAAFEPRLSRHVAIKVLRPELQLSTEAGRRFWREAQALARLRHPHILPIYTIGEREGITFLVMPRIDGNDLGEYLRGAAPLPVEEARRLMLEIADALQSAHDAGVVHRDVKPSNILLDGPERSVLLTDFGISKLVRPATPDVASDADKLTLTGEVMGSPAYMSPEQAAGSSDVDARTDVYSLGVIGFELLAGRRPFEGESRAAVMAKHVTERPPDVRELRPDVPPALADAVMGCLEKAPEARWPSTRAFADATRGRAAPRGRPKLRRLLTRRRQFAVSTVLVFIVISVVGARAVLGSFGTLPFSQRDWILIGDVDNQTADSTLGYGLHTALTVGLQQSQHLNVFSRERSARTLQRMLRDPTEPISIELGREIAQREDIGLLVVPAIAPLGSSYSLSFRVIDPITGNVLSAYAAKAQDKSKVLSALDELSRRLRRDVGESRLSIMQRGLPLDKATTSSLEALRAVTEGNWFWGTNRQISAERYRRAIELDPDFAWAHHHLGAYYYWNSQEDLGEQHLQKALDLLPNVTERERLWIEANTHSWRNHREEAIRVYEVLVSRYPDYWQAWANIGYAQHVLGNYDEAIAAYERSLEIYPANSSILINLATSYNGAGRNAEAIPYYEEAFALDPSALTWMNINHEYGFNYVEAGDIEAAQRTFRAMLSGSAEQQAGGHRSLALLDMYRGRYAAAVEHLDQAVELTRSVDAKVSEFRNRLYLVTAHRARGDLAAAERELRSATAIARQTYLDPNWLERLAHNWLRSEEVQLAREILEMATPRLDEQNPAHQSAEQRMRGGLASAMGEHKAAIAALQVALSLRPDNEIRGSLAEAYVASGDLERAAEVYSQIVNDRTLGWEAQEPWVFAHYRLGRIRERQADTTRAIEHYRSFVRLFQDGDADLPSLVDAKSRLERLDTRDRR